jgi:hypothetical protein
MTASQWQVVCDQIKKAGEWPDPLFHQFPTRAVARHHSRKAPKESDE